MPCGAVAGIALGVVSGTDVGADAADVVVDGVRSG